jgi:catecholate siderophore receptor
VTLPLETVSLAEWFNHGKESVAEQPSRGVGLTSSGLVRPGLQVIAGYSYLISIVTNGVGTITAPFSSAKPMPLQGKTLGLASRHAFRLWTLKSIDALPPGVQVGAGLASRSCSYANVGNAVVMPGFTTGDAAVYGRPAPKGWSVALNLKNVFSRHYYISADNDAGILPGAPRTAEVTARYAF